MTEENKPYLRPKFEKENEAKDKEEIVQQVKIKPEAGSKSSKRIALFHINGNGDPDETQRASPQVQAYLKAFESMENVIVDVYPDNEAKFKLPYQYIAPFPIEVTDHLYWSESTLDSYANDIWNHWKTNPHLIPSIIITIGPASVYVCNTLFERFFWKIPWIYHGHWNIPEVDRKVNPDYFRVEDYAFTSADAIVYNNFDERKEALILREQYIDERHVVIDDLEMYLYSLKMESEEKYNEEEKNNNINVENYYGVFTSNNPRLTRKETINEEDLKKQISNKINNIEKEKNENDTTTTIADDHTSINKLKSKNPTYNEEYQGVIDQNYKKLTPEQKDEWIRKYGINEEELIGKNRDTYDALIDKYTNIMDKCNQYQDKIYTRGQSCTYYEYKTFPSFIKYQERKKLFGYVKFALCIPLFFILIQNLTKEYTIPPMIYILLYSVYLIYLLTERIWVKKYTCGNKENLKFLGKLILIGIAIYYRYNNDIRCIGTGCLFLLVDGFWNGLTEGIIYELNLKWTITKLIHVMFVRLILFPIWFFVGLMSRYKFIYFIFFGVMYLFNWNISYKVL
ncbi:hypothetical protein BCR32DRAFT_268797, partial [Anaeromyces robustus]